MSDLVTNFDLSEEQEMIRDTVRQFAREVGLPAAWCTEQMDSQARAIHRYPLISYAQSACVPGW